MEVFIYLFIHSSAFVVVSSLPNILPSFLMTDGGLTSLATDDIMTKYGDELAIEAELSLVDCDTKQTE